MKYRKYGNISDKISEIGFGTWQLGNTIDWNGPNEEESLELVKKAIEYGINFFDTAPNYGEGKSELILGKALKNIREKVIINTKIGHIPGKDIKNFDVDIMKESIENSLKKLDTDYIDTVLLHNPPIDMLDNDTPQFKLLEDLKRQRIIREYGASLDFAQEVDRLLERTQSEVIEILFNIFFQDVRDSFQKIEEKNMGIIVKVPLDSGWLTGKYNENSKFRGIRNRWKKEDIERRSKLLNDIKEIKNNNESMTLEALRYILGYDIVSTIAVGSKNINQLKENVKAVEKRLEKEKIEKYEKLYNEKIRKNLLPW